MEIILFAIVSFLTGATIVPAYLYAFSHQEMYAGMFTVYVPSALMLIIFISISGPLFGILGPWFFIGIIVHGIASWIANNIFVYRLF